VIGTFLTVAFLTLKNKILQRVRRLREPRYLIGGIVGLAYLWFMIFRRTMAGAQSSNGKLIMKTLAISPVVADCASVILLLLMITAWALPADSGGLEFSEAEIALLFPAPLRRRDILLYKILRAQPQALFSALFMTVFGWWRNGLFVGVWAAISVLGVYFMLVSLGRARLRLMRIGFLARLAGVAAIVAGLYWIAKSEVSAINFKALKNAPQVMNALSVPFHKPLIRTILFIPRLIASAAIPPSFSMLAIRSSSRSESAFSTSPRDSMSRSKKRRSGYRKRKPRASSASADSVRERPCCSGARRRRSSSARQGRSKRRSSGKISSHSRATPSHGS